MKNILKKLWIGLLIYVLGFIIISYCVEIRLSGVDIGQYQFFYAIVFSILYLAGVVGVCTTLIIEEIKKNIKKYES